MDKILVLDFGGQYDQLIARRVRELEVYAEIRSFRKITLQQIRDEGYKGIIFTGGPHSVYGEDSPSFDAGILDCGIPILGICYGMQLMVHLSKGVVSKSIDGGEYGKRELAVGHNILFEDVPATSVCWMSHSDQVSELPSGFVSIAETASCPYAAICDETRKLYGVQFHPEVTHTEYGKTIISNFVFSICNCGKNWRMDDFISDQVSKYRDELKGKKVLLGLSGGVDSSVAALLLHKAIGKDLVCVFVDHGFLRKNEAETVEKTFRDTFDLNLITVDAKERFLKKLEGISDPETKRKIIGNEFISVFEEEAEKLGKIDVLAQGTIYPDVIESGKGDSAVIKSHHNVGGLPEHMSFEQIVEPLRDLFKDEVRKVGTELGLPHDLVYRQPFPGPGLAVRVLGEISREKLEILKEADAIFTQEIADQKMQDLTDQYFAVITSSRSVGVKGDARIYGYTIALRAVKTDDFMTAEWSRLPYELLEKVSSRIANEVNGVSRVVYDITSKPPGTVEWE
ncbi:MAG: glutamine-hydrolyzing GMP synthase [Erysipelotrichaceae bacterium]|nr:glutamine-hydrolyzing GMP synthase [Erysipelotrichaceae bacterium]